MAVYTALSDEDIWEFLGGYALPPLASAQGILAGVENTNYVLNLQDGSRYILTLFEKRVKAEDLPFFVGLMEQLASRGVPSPKPIKARNGQALNSLKGKHALIVTFLPGKSTTAIQVEHLGELGSAMAQMHEAGKDFPMQRENNLSLQGWKTLANTIAVRADEIAPGLKSEIENEMKWLEANWPRNLPSGVIHADLFPDNVFFEGVKPKLSGIIDFYFACNDTFAYELAICLNCWCFERNHEFNITRAKQMLRAYNSVRPMGEGELDALPVLARGAALRFLLTRAHDKLFPVTGALVTPKDPMEYVKKLRFHQNVKHHKEYGL